MKPIANPLDALFDTLPQELEDAQEEYQTMSEGELAAITPQEGEVAEKDAEDLEIDGKIDTIYDAALEAFNTQTAYMEVIEPRYAARNAEVAANYLNIALSAANSRAKVKSDRKKNAAFVPFSNKRSDGTVVASREDIMRMIAVDAETKKV